MAELHFAAKSTSSLFLWVRYCLLHTVGEGFVSIAASEDSEDAAATVRAALCTEFSAKNSFPAAAKTLGRRRLWAEKVA